jgi:hypothetical protein
MGEEMAYLILRTTCDFHGKCTDLLHAAKLRHGTDGFTSSPEEGMLRIFVARKIRRLQPGLNLRTWVQEVSMLTTRPLKLLSTAVGRGRAGRTDHDQQHCYHHAPTVKPEDAAAVVELLMMGVRKPETC